MYKINRQLMFDVLLRELRDANSKRKFKINTEMSSFLNFTRSKLWCNEFNESIHCISTPGNEKRNLNFYVKYPQWVALVEFNNSSLLFRRT